ncbi:P-loop NTPase fold protein [Lysinibacillus sp. NPDC097162]|uniref:P-loop NTPase fold protein n=1 Tax=Lysinibacillus sp. NPDC097162 TaxID=3364140 RepID=UPI0037F50C04
MRGAQQVTTEIMKRFNSPERGERPLIVAIDGLGGVGKTTFVNKLASALENDCVVNVLHIDDYIVESEKRYNTGNEEWFEYYYLQWDIKFIKESLLKIHNGHLDLTLPFYNRAMNTVINSKKHFVLNSILLIEGVFLQRNEWRRFYDYTIFLECPKHVREERVLKRDSYIGDVSAIRKKYESRYWVAEEYYLKKEVPLQKADIIWHAEYNSDY